MNYAELGDPCLPHVGEDTIGGDRRTGAMKAVYELIFSLNADKPLSKQEIYSIIEEHQEFDDRLSWFGNFSGEEKLTVTTKAGIALKSFQNRVLGGIVLRIDSSDSNSRRHKISFHKA
jgi:hypothetical protein